MSSNGSTSADSNLKTLQENINQLETRFEKIRQDGVAKLNECSECITAAKQLCSKTIQVNTDAQNKLANVSNEEKEWKDIKVKLATTSIKGKIVLDVGGERYTTSVETLINKLQGGFSDSTLLTTEQERKLSEFNGNNTQAWELIYKASRDGFDANAFHSRCDNKGPTMTIIRSNNGYLFGGYTSISWASDSSYKNDDKAFIFTLTNPHNIPPTKYLIKPDGIGYAVYHHSSYGPTFGGGHDIRVVNGSNSNNSSYCNFPVSYNDTTGQGKNTFTGACNFTTSDIEVFKLV